MEFYITLSKRIKAVKLGMGKTCEPKAFSFQCMTEFTTNKKKEIKKKKEKKKSSFKSRSHLLKFISNFFCFVLSYLFIHTEE